MATLEGPLYVVRMQEEQIKKLPYDKDDIGVHSVNVYFKQLANKRSSQPGLYLLAGAKAGLMHWREQHPDNEYFTYKFDILPVHITFGDPIQ